MVGYTTIRGACSEQAIRGAGGGMRYRGTRVEAKGGAHMVR
jgi:hypothetical protein